MNPAVFILIVAHEICSTVEQILFKKSANYLKRPSLKTPGDFFRFIVNVLKIPAIWLAFLMIAAAWSIWFVVLARIDLSIAVPVDSLQYVMILISSYFFLGERMHWTRIAGTIFILLGILVVARS